MLKKVKELIKKLNENRMPGVGFTSLITTDQLDILCLF